MSEPEFDIVHEYQVYKRYLTVYDRCVRFPPSKERQAAEFRYDVVGHPQCEFQYTVVLPFHRPSQDKAGEVTILREYCQGPNKMMFALPTGGYNPSKHSDQLECANAELSEEARLHGGTWHALLPEGHTGIAEVKWCANRLVPFLCIDPQDDTSPGVRDDEELIEIHRVGLREFRQILVSGEMQLPSIVTGFMALDLLQTLQLI